MPTPSELQPALISPVGRRERVEQQAVPLGRRERVEQQTVPQEWLFDAAEDPGILRSFINRRMQAQESFTVLWVRQADRERFVVDVGNWINSLLQYKYQTYLVELASEGQDRNVDGLAKFVIYNHRANPDAPSLTFDSLIASFDQPLMDGSVDRLRAALDKKKVIIDQGQPSQAQIREHFVEYVLAGMSYGLAVDHPFFRVILEKHDVLSNSNSDLQRVFIQAIFASLTTISEGRK